MFKKFSFVLTIFIAVINFNTRADEGMWLPLLIERLNYVDMQKMGCHLTAEEIYSINHSSLKDAIVQLGNGCTGEAVSDEGLILTNYHCGYDAIQSYSTVEHDYLTTGFWAKSKEEELTDDGLTVTFLIRIEDVTQKVMNELNDTMTVAERIAKIDAITAKLKAEAIKDTYYDASVKSFFEGNEYYLFVYEIFKDVRLVGAPPTSIGQFGGDTDNWMWPRHTGDFCMFRVYTGTDGRSAEYSKNNIPLKPKHTLPISISGYKTNDFAMILGYPGSTDRFLTSYGVKLALEQFNPSIVKIRGKKLSIMKSDMDKSAVIRIKYASKYITSSNYWKFYIGQSKGLVQLKVYDKKTTIETAFEQWVNSNEKNKTKYGEALTDIANAYIELTKYVKAKTYFVEGLIRGCEIIGFANKFESLYNEYKKEKTDNEKINKNIVTLKATIATYYKDYNAPTDQKMFAAMFELFFDDISAEYHPDIFTTITKKYNNDFTKFASEIFQKSIFADQKKAEAFIANPDKIQLDKDPGFKLMLSVMKKYREIIAKITEANLLLSKGNRLFVAGLREMYPDKKFYPNANSTMRLTYGKVLDYYPADAVHYEDVTSLKGIMEKEDSTNEEFIVPKKLKDLYLKKDYGKYAEDGEIKVCFLTDNDITGGNSGSPVINGDGQLIGIAFDGNWEAMSGNIVFEPSLQRSICVDIRYILFIIDKYAGATNLIKEMNIVEKSSGAKNTQ
ncbi:MAG: S46 family peptidase [Bacteroidales bacterium]